MRSLLRRVKERKKSRRLGDVEMLERGAYQEPPTRRQPPSDPPILHGPGRSGPTGRLGYPSPPHMPLPRMVQQSGPQLDPRQRARARRHAPDRPQDPRHLRTHSKCTKNLASVV